MTPTSGAKSASLTTYLQVRPLRSVLLFFFVVPVALVIVVSFFRYQMLVGMVPEFTFRNYVEFVTNPTTWALYHLDGEVYADRIGDYLRSRFLDSLLLSISRQESAHGHWPFPSLHSAFLDVEHHSNDLVAAGSRQGRPDQQRAYRGGMDQQAIRVAALFRFLSGGGLRPPVHALHDRADFQFDGAHRQIPAGGCCRRRRHALGRRVERRVCPFRRPASRWARCSS